jgi:DNA-directed RNA polymerase subunit M/transcription elongation factor TFIIS
MTTIKLSDYDKLIGNSNADVKKKIINKYDKLLYKHIDKKRSINMINDELHDNTISTKLEHSINMYSIVDVLKHQYNDHWIVDIYKDTLDDIVYMLTKKDLLDYIKKHKDNIKDIPYIMHDIQKQYNKKNKIQIQVCDDDNDSGYICPKCKGNKCTVKELQIRKADEPPTIYTTCRNCGNTEIEEL